MGDPRRLAFFSLIPCGPDRQRELSNLLLARDLLFPWDNDEFADSPVGGNFEPEIPIRYVFFRCNRSVPRLAQQLRGGQAGPMRHDRAIQVVQHRTFL